MSSWTNSLCQSHMLNDSQDQVLIFWMSNHGGPFLSSPLWSAHFCFLFRFSENQGVGGGAGWRGKKVEKKRKEKKMKPHLICSPISAAGGVSAEWVMCRVFLFFSRTCLCTQSSGDCCFTATSNCPQATGSHFQAGSFIFQQKRKWSLALILNHPHATVYKVIKEALYNMYIHKHTRQETVSSGGRRLVTSQETSASGRTWEGTSPLCEAVLRWNWSGDYGSPFWIVLPFVVLSSKSKRGIRVDWMLSYAKSCDRGRRWEKHGCERKWTELCVSENWKFLPTWISLSSNIVGNQMKCSFKVYFFCLVA